MNADNHVAFADAERARRGRIVRLDDMLHFEVMIA